MLWARSRPSINGPDEATADAVAGHAPPRNDRNRVTNSQAVNRDEAVVLITGAAGDIGSAAAHALSGPDRTLILADHPSAVGKLAATAQQLRQVAGAVIETTFDVVDRTAVAGALRAIVNEGTVPTLVFNNAGYQGSFERIDRMSSDDAAQVLAVNVLGVFNVMAEVSSVLIERGRPGAIVNTASMAGVSGAPNMAAYSASKAAVIGLTKSAAKDLAPFGIRINAISPAFIGPGAMWDRQVELQAAAQSQYYSHDPVEVARQMIGMVPLRRFGSTEEVANVVRFLLSDLASYLTGVNIEISGGSA
jgi:NAD(P)-dependent dehydrogenase (short-subunit alcohol dehydrogenase family)